MEHNELYEKLRVILGTGHNEILTGETLGLVKHKATFKMLKSLYSEEEANVLVNGFRKAGELLSTGDVSQALGISESSVERILDDMRIKGKIIRMRGSYMLIPLYPGGFEVYFTRDKDDPEKRKKVAEAHFELLEAGLIHEIESSGYSRFRVIPAIGPTKQIIDINKSVDTEKIVLTFEILKDHILNMDTDQFAVVPCPDRNAAKLAGRPCKRTDENFCITAGSQVKGIVKQGIGRQVSFDELMEILERAEKEGLVHQTTNIQDSALFLCNCCSCCCPYLISAKKMGIASAKSNFEPKIDPEACTLCEECKEICPMEAIHHHFPHREDGTDDFMMIDAKLCIGCGVCASNCPDEAITLEKIRDVLPVESHKEFIQKLSEGARH